jgi:hypothetical protein
MKKSRRVIKIGVKVEENYCNLMDFALKNALKKRQKLGAPPSPRICFCG